MKQKTMNRILIGLFGVIGIICVSSSVFGKDDVGVGRDGVNSNKIKNSVCIEYVTPSGLTGTTCSNVSIIYTGGGNPDTGENKYTMQKFQKTGGMTNYTQNEIIVESGEYISYKIEFACVEGSCKSAKVQDTLPNCVNYVSSSITGVIGSPTFYSGSSYIEYSNFSLNGTNTGYLFVTGQIITSTPRCQNVTGYTNVGKFKCTNPSSDRMQSSVVAKRNQGGESSGSVVSFEKTGNKYEMYPGETGLIFTMTVKNTGPATISDIYIDDIWPGNNDCIQYSGWRGNYIEYLENYKWHYTKTLKPGNYFTLYVYANIKNDPSCVGPYINTGKLTYQEGGKSYVLYDDYSFIVVDDGVGYDVSIEKSVSDTNVVHGQEITYTIKYTNTGRKPLTKYTITDEWPSDKLQSFRVVSMTPQATNYQGERSGNIVTWEFNTPLLVGHTGQIVIQGVVR